MKNYTTILYKVRKMGNGLITDKPESPKELINRVSDTFFSLQRNLTSLYMSESFTHEYNESLNECTARVNMIQWDINNLIDTETTDTLILKDILKYVNQLDSYLHELNRVRASNLSTIKNDIQKLCDSIKVALEEIKNKHHEPTETQSLSSIVDVQKKDDFQKSCKEFINDYLEYVKGNHAVKTYENASRVLNLFLKLIGDKSLSDIKLRDIEEFKKYRMGKVKNTTLNIDIRTLKAAFEVAVDWELINSNPFKKAKQIRIEQKEPRYLKKDEIEKVCKATTNKQIRDIIRFAAETGLRRGELLNLKWSDIDFKLRVIKVESGKGDAYKVKGGNMRKVPLTSTAVKILKNQVKKKSELVFPNRKGDVLDGDFVSRKFKESIRATGLSDDFRFHDLRATFASWSITSGIPIYAVKEMLGHSSVITTQGYSKFDNEQLLSEIKKFRIGRGSEKIDVDLLKDVLDGGT